MKAERVDFHKFWFGQTISQLGSSFTLFALPLLVFKRTGSALDLGIAAALNILPYLLFGLVLGAWVDRKDRRRLMVLADVARALVIASVPVLELTRAVPVWWLYGVGFVSTTLTIVFEAGEFAALPSLASGQDLVALNGRIQASYSTAQVLGPVLAGLLVAVLPVSTLLALDAASFLVSAASLALIRRRFNAEEGPPASSIRDDVREGLRYVVSHPVLRGIAVMMALANMLVASAGTLLVVLAKQRWSASDTQLGWLYSAASLGMVSFALLAGPLRKRLSFSVLALSALAVNGASIVGMGLASSYGVALGLWGICGGTAILFNVLATSLRQAIVPNQLLGRVTTTGSVLAWSTIPVGVLTSGALVQSHHDSSAAYLVLGVAMLLIPCAFAFTAVGHADRYLPAPDAA